MLEYFRRRKSIFLACSNIKKHMIAFNPLEVVKKVVIPFVRLATITMIISSCIHDIMTTTSTQDRSPEIFMNFQYLICYQISNIYNIIIYDILGTKIDHSVKLYYYIRINLCKITSKHVYIIMRVFLYR